MAAEDNRIPCTILTGYLGSGKTTLVNHILTDKTHKKKIAIIENEFGDVGIDDALMAKNAKEQVEEEIIEMMNGCICCTVRQDLVVVLKKFADRIKAGTLKNLDCVIIETTGMADPAPVAQTFFVDDEVSKSFRLDGIVTLIDAKHVEQHLDEEKPEGEENEAIEQVAFADRMILNKTDLVTEDDLARLEKRLKSMNSSAPIIRSAKRGERRPDPGHSRVRPEEDGRDGPEFLNTENEHEHDTTVSSVSVVEKRPLDLDAIQRWVNYLLVNKGTDLYRMKGVLNIANSDERFMFQAVHMIFNGTFDEPWLADETRESRFVFIGKNLDHDELKKGFEKCVLTPELAAKRLEDLRFDVGDAVVCNTSSGWVDGNVIGRMYRDDYMPAGVVAPYQVKLNDGTMIWAPEDDDDFIRAGGSKKAKTSE